MFIIIFGSLSTAYKTDDFMLLYFHRFALLSASIRLPRYVAWSASRICICVFHNRIIGEETAAHLRWRLVFMWKLILVYVSSVIILLLSWNNMIEIIVEKVLLPVLEVIEDHETSNMILRIMCEAWLDYIYLHRIKFR